MRMFAVGAIAIAVVVGAASKNREPNGLGVREEPDRVVLKWNGPVEPPMLERFQEVFRQRGDDQRRIVISLSSPGGLIEHGYQVIAEIRRFSRTHTVDTLVEAGRTCASMCVPIFLTGADRIAHPDAQFMFHEVSIRLRPEAEQKLRQLQREAPMFDVQGLRKSMIVKATDEFYEDYFAPRGVNSRWLSQMREQVRGRDVWRTGDQLMKQGSGVVDVLR